MYIVTLIVTLLCLCKAYVCRVQCVLIADSCMIQTTLKQMKQNEFKLISQLVKCLMYSALSHLPLVSLVTSSATIPPAALYGQLTNICLIVHGSPLNLAKDPLATVPSQSAMIAS